MPAGNKGISIASNWTVRGYPPFAALFPGNYLIKKRLYLV